MSLSHQVSLQLFLDRLMERSVLSDEEQQAVRALPGHMIELNARQHFVHVHEESSYSCLIVAGLVARVGYTGTGARQITAFHIPGDMADLHSAVRPIGIGGLQAVSRTTVLRVPHRAIRELAAHYPAISEAPWRDCMLDAAILMQWVVNVGRRDARTRLAHLLCEMAVRYGADRQVLRTYRFPITQEQLADATALTSVHVNRSLKTLRADRLVEIRSGTVEIGDWDGLATVGEFDAAYLVADTAPERQKRLLAVM